MFKHFDVIAEGIVKGDYQPLLKMVTTENFDINTKLRNGLTLLHLAVEACDVWLVETLLQAGACPNSPMSNGLTPLRRAAKRDNTAIARLLISHGACDHVTLSKMGLANTALHAAAFHGNQALCQLLIAHGSQKCLQDFDRKTPAMRALQAGHEALAHYLEPRQLALHVSSKPESDAYTVCYKGKQSPQQLNQLIYELNRRMDETAVLEDASLCTA